MNYTEKILQILSEELDPYIAADGKVCIDGVLTSAQRINELIGIYEAAPCKGKAEGENTSGREEQVTAEVEQFERDY